MSQLTPTYGYIEQYRVDNVLHQYSEQFHLVDTPAGKKLFVQNPKILNLECLVLPRAMGKSLLHYFPRVKISTVLPRQTGRGLL